MNASRRTMALSTASTAAETPNARIRPLVPADAPALARLMFDAYAGTLDGEGGTLEGALAEVQNTFAGGYGPMAWDASFVVPSANEPGVLASASVVTFFRDEALLAFSMTLPNVARRGLAGALICTSARALAALGRARVLMSVTVGNTPAERLYEKLGFVDVPPPS